MVRLGSHSDEHRELHDMISTLTHRLTNLGKPTEGGSSTTTGDHGLGIITLAGSNKGAVMQADRLDEALNGYGAPPTGGGGSIDEKAVSACTNSNYQAVNNSIVFEGSCTVEDPGVHIVISDFLGDEEDGDEDEDEDEHEKEGKKDKKKGKKGKKDKEKKDKKKEEGSSHEEEQSDEGKDEKDSESE